MTDGDWKGLASQLTAGLTAGLLAFGITKSPTAGIYAFSIAASLDLARLTDNLPDPSVTAQKFKDWVASWISIDAMKQFGADIGNGLIDGLMNILKLFDIVGALQTAWGLLFNKSGKTMGAQVADGFVQGLEEADIEGRTETFWETIQRGWNMVWKIRSPSRVSKEMGEYVAEGFYLGMDNETYWEKITAAWESRMQALQSQTGINVDDAISGIVGGGTATPTAVPSFLDDILGGFVDMFGQLGPLISSLGSVTALLDPFGTILSGIMEVLGPVIDSVLAPLVGILKVFGHMIGGMLAPALQILTPIIEVVSKAFVWFYNNVLLHVGNAIIKMFNGIGMIVAYWMNAISWIIKKFTFGLIDLGQVAVPDENRGMLKAIDMGTLTEAGGASGTSYTGGGTGSSTSVQSVTINVYQRFDGPVVGDGGLEAVGEFMVRAIQAYSGVGGSVQIVGVI
jgi:hypothetical protein